jgi:nicotinamidase-related amidase
MGWLRAFTLAIGLSCTWARTALLVIDVQKCFIGNGSLGVPAAHIVPEINKMMSDKACLFDDIVYSQDFHPANHISFASSHGLQPFVHLSKGPLPLLCIKPESGLTKDAACCPTIHVAKDRVNCSAVLCPEEGWNYTINNSNLVDNNPACTQCAADPDACYPTVQEMWTDHCLKTGDSGFPDDLNMGSAPKIVKKGVNQFVDAYSAFKDNSKQVETELNTELSNKKIDELVVVGIATDVCVKESVRDAIDYGYKVSVVKDATAAVLGNQENFDAAIEYMRAKGAAIKTVADIMDMNCDDGAIPSSTLGFVVIVGVILSMTHLVGAEV